jgi:hypothetical protein
MKGISDVADPDCNIEQSRTRCDVLTGAVLGERGDRIGWESWGKKGNKQE